MKKSEQIFKSFVLKFVTICNAVLFYNTIVLGWCGTGTTTLVSNYSNNSYQAAMDITTYNNPVGESDVWIVKPYDIGYDSWGYWTWGYEITKIHMQTSQVVGSPVVERFGANNCSPVLTPGFCINRADGYPQLLGRAVNSSRLVHYWRDPNRGWVLEHYLSTAIKIEGAPAMICNRVPPYNLEVVYKPAPGEYRPWEYRFIWRGTDNTWNETCAFLPLPPNCGAYSEPAIAQTRSGRIHVAAIVYNFGTHEYKLAHWVRDAHAGGDWEMATLYEGSPAIWQDPTVKPVIMSLEHRGFDDDVLILCSSSYSSWWTIGGYKTDYYCYNNDHTLEYYPCELDFGKNIYNIAGSPVEYGNYWFLNLTSKRNDGSYSNNFLRFTGDPSRCR
jgi:hypothetical protein